MILANLVHLSYNMWRDMSAPADAPPERRDIYYVPQLRCDQGLWRECIECMSEAGMNMLVVDVGDGIEFRSRPEIAVDGAWSAETLKDELAFCRDRGVEPIPKLNFSACHDAWLGPYSRRLSTPEYYEVCADLIEETCEAFGGPRFFHLGMDEETYRHQQELQYAVIQQGELWWNDLNFLVARVEAAGGRAWVWSDVIWNGDVEAFGHNMPRSVLQSNWYYGKEFSGDDPHNYVTAFEWLEQMGFEQVPTGSTWSNDENYPRLVEHCTARIPESRLLGFMMADWRPMTQAWRQTHLDAVGVVARAHGLG